jgi:uncharacterized protein (TIGR02996 family)
MASDFAFLREIVAHPDDDAPRLIYADWLEEHGDPRGEFIRLQCELARLPDGGPQRGRLKTRSEQLLSGRHIRWANDIGALVNSWAYQRGFVEEIRLAASQFIKHAVQIFGLAPVRHVKLDNLGAINSQRFLLVPCLAQLRTLDLSDNALSLRDVRRLASSPHLAGLTSLILKESRIDTEAARLLAESPHLAGLTLLDLRGNSVAASVQEGLRRRFGDGVLF